MDRIESVGEVRGSRLACLVGVRAVPERGLANAAFMRLVADVAGWPKSALSLEQGSKSRVKVSDVSGEPAHLAEGLARLRALAGGVR